MTTYDIISIPYNVNYSGGSTTTYNTSGTLYFKGSASTVLVYSIITNWYGCIIPTHSSEFRVNAGFGRYSQEWSTIADGTYAEHLDCTYYASGWRGGSVSGDVGPTLRIAEGGVDYTKALKYKYGSTTTGNISTKTCSYYNGVAQGSADQSLTAVATYNTNYTFVGFEDDGGGTVDGRKVTFTYSASDQTAIALYKEMFTVVFHSNYGTEEETYSQSCVNVSTDTLGTNSFTRTGYGFVKWNTAADGSGVDVANGEELDTVFTDCSGTAGGTINLYAVWEYRMFDLTVSKGNTASGATLPSGVGTLKLLDSNGDVVATESDDTLSYLGGTAGEEYTLMCEMPSTKPSLLYDANGIWDSSTQTYSSTLVFTPAVGDRLTKVYKFTAKALYSVAVSATPSGNTASITNPSEADSDGKYVVNRTPTITGVPATGYFLSEANVYSGGYNVATYSNITDNAFTLAALSQDISVVCTFAQVDYDIAAEIDEASESAIDSVRAETGSQTGEAECTAHYGDTVTFTAILKSGFSGTFAGFYDGSTCHAGTQTSSNPKTYTYTHTVTGPVTLVAKAQVSVSMTVYYYNNASVSSPTQTCSVTLAPPSPVILGNSVDFTLTLGNVSASSSNKWIFDAWFNVSSPQVFTDPLEYEASGTLTPTENVSMVARVSSKVITNVIAVHVENDESSTGTYLDASTALTTDPAADSGGWNSSAKRYVLTFNGTKKVKFFAADAITVSGTELSFSKFVLGSREYTESPAIILSSFGGSTSSPGKSMTMYYGATGTRTVSLAYGVVGDTQCTSEQGTFTITETSDTETPSPIAEDGHSATVKRGKTIRIVVSPNNGYKFDGWYASQVKGGSAVETEADWTMTVNTNRTLYAMFSQDTNAVYEWEGSSTKKRFEWRSKTYVAARPFNPTCCRVDTEGYPIAELTVDMFSAPNTTGTASTTLLENVASQTARRLPERRPERYMQVCVKNNHEVDAIYVGSNMTEIAK